MAKKKLDVGDQKAEDEKMVEDVTEQTKPESAEIEKPVDKTEEKKASDKSKKTKVKASKQSRRAKPSGRRQRSKKYQDSIKDLDKDQQYPIDEAIKLVKDSSYSKFDGTFTLHIQLSKSKKKDEAIRGTIKLPHGTGKKQKIEIVSIDLIEKIQKGYSDFDVLIASSEMMPKLAQVAKILGPKGKMPNPKDGTVSDNPEQTAKDLDQIAPYRMDAGRNLHINVGKVSWENAKIAENIAVVLKALTHHKKDSVTLSPSMGSGVKIAL
ncbi:MAG: hypothetical protein ABIJ72_02220 [bacterium]|nr:hypothetical protein [Patescibacteria group bacterium]